MPSLSERLDWSADLPSIAQDDITFMGTSILFVAPRPNPGSFDSLRSMKAFFPLTNAHPSLMVALLGAQWHTLILLFCLEKVPRFPLLLDLRA